MLFKILFFVALFVNVADAHANELEEWVSALGLVVVAHESGHAMSGYEVDVPINMQINSGGPHYMTNFSAYPAFHADPGTVEQFQFNHAVVAAYNSAIAAGSVPPVSSAGVWNAYGQEVQAGNKINAAVRVWSEPMDRKLAYIAGAGFAGQQDCEHELTGSLKAKYLILSGLFYKLGYAAFPKSLQPGVKLGDVEAFRPLGGYDVARVSLALSGLSDVYRGVFDPQSNWSVGFYRSIRGQPGLQFSCVF